MPSYRTPNRINSVSVTLFVLFVIAGYVGYVFFPVYWDAWTVDHELRESASESYQLMLRPEPDRTEDMRALLVRARAKCIKLAHITDPDFDVTMDLVGEIVTLHAKYDVKVTDPVFNHRTVIHFDRVATSNNKRVQWE